MFETITVSASSVPSGSFASMAIVSIDTVQSYHAHIYFDGPEQANIAKTLRERIAERFSVVMGRWWDEPIGPHARPMYQVAFAPDDFARVVPWLMLNRHGLAILIHPNTRHPRRDHLSDALWLGEILAIKADPFLVEHEAPEPPLVPNTSPTVVP
ncbi:DOPA 4,5-dioxygenase family protein [Nitrospirillum sp. BR 11163]|uniref:DOPA 4,5-dioxygenase family protein n=1 Tax=Nitrospirillum sp. BR 11163 TaxID=3104323 RepID=UPI002B002781|nr:DOPA 4,5-dioxygenase family protein [Nitrospirillum sp. BR 11163]MEA1672857.1 DOPA 4,5-dioxygenase family protein [Nitrospirillum sp. BR 11163]